MWLKFSAREGKGCSLGGTARGQGELGWEGRQPCSLHGIFTRQTAERWPPKGKAGHSV